MKAELQNPSNVTPEYETIMSSTRSDSLNGKLLPVENFLQDLGLPSKHPFNREPDVDVEPIWNDFSEWSILNYVIPSYQETGTTLPESSMFPSRSYTGLEYVDYHLRYLVESGNILLARLSLNMAEIGLSMWCLFYLILSLIAPFVVMAILVYII